MEHIKEKPVQPGQIANITPSPPSDGFPHSSVGKESACNAGDPGSIPGSGSSPREGIGYPLQYSCASLVAQTVKNLPEMWETWVWSLGQEDPLRREWLPTPVFLPGESLWTEEPGELQSMVFQRALQDWVINTFTLSLYIFIKDNEWVDKP